LSPERVSRLVRGRSPIERSRVDTQMDTYSSVVSTVETVEQR
jgi:hypothetical protein